MISRLPVPHRRAALFAASVATLVVLCVYLAHLVAIHRDYGLTDFNSFYASARLALEGKSLYDPAPYRRFAPHAPSGQAEGAVLEANLNPPVQALLLLPLSELPLPAAFLAWSLLSLALGFA